MNVQFGFRCPTWYIVVLGYSFATGEMTWPTYTIGARLSGYYLCLQPHDMALINQLAGFSNWLVFAPIKLIIIAMHSLMAGLIMQQTV